MNQVGRYQIREELGRGACGVVYRALDPAIGRTVAIKSIRFSDFSDPGERRDLRERVLREAQAAGKLSHPNIVTIYDVLEGSDVAYIFMEFVDGPSLKDAMQRDALPRRDQAIGILRQLAEALDYAHRKGIIHRDIKPANIMISDRGVDKDGVAKIADFGIAKLISHEATHQRAFMGTPSYMSPEQLEGVSVGGATDQFALAVIVYELLTGEKPFAAENLAALHYQICKRPAKPVHEINPTLSEAVNRVVERAMAKLPEERYGSCSEFIGALSLMVADCAEWRPLAPRIPDETDKAGGNGWYAPETVVSSRLLDGESADEPTVLTPVVLPPEPAMQTAMSRRVATEEERGQYAAYGLGLRPQSSGTRVRVGVDRPAARTWGLAMAACAAMAVLGIGLLRVLSIPKASTTAIVDTGRVLTTSTPEDLSTTNRPAARTPVDLSVPPAAPPVSTDSSDASTTVTVRTPVARQEPAPPPPVIATPPKPLAALAKTVREPIRVAPPTPAPVEEAEVELVSDPPGAQVEVDHRSDTSCLAPCSVPLSPGRHTLFAQLQGYGTTRKIFSVPVDGNVFVSMNRNVGTLLFTSNPAGADVKVDGKDYGPAPITIHLSAGSHHLSISDGSRHHEETIEITTDGLYARSFRW